MLDSHWLLKRLLKSDCCLKKLSRRTKCSTSLDLESSGLYAGAYKKFVPFFWTHFISWQSVWHYQYQLFLPTLTSLFFVLLTTYYGHMHFIRVLYKKRWNTPYYLAFQLLLVKIYFLYMMGYFPSFDFWFNIFWYFQFYA